MIVFFIMTEMTESETERLRQAFNAQGLRFTPQRLEILNAFREREKGLTIAEAGQLLKERGIGHVTVYRTVKALTEMGRLRFAHDDEGRRRYVAGPPGHWHLLICRGCGKTVEFADCDLSLLEKLISLKTGFTIEGHHLELRGLCPACEPAEPARTATTGCGCGAH